MLSKLASNLKLLTLSYQHIKTVELKPMFMDWWNNENSNTWWGREKFNYSKHNRQFVRWIERNPPACIQGRFQGAHYGIYEHAFLNKLMVSVIAKVPITNGNYNTIEHREVINLLVENCSLSCALASALVGVGDVMVSDYHGNQDHDILWYKALYLKFAVTRGGAAQVLMNEVPMLKSLQGRDKISWGAEMSNSNRPPSRHEALALQQQQQQQQQVVLECPTGHIDTQLFTRQSIDAVQPMASTNVSFQFAEQLASVAVTGGQGIHQLMAGTSLQNTLSYEEFG